MSVLPSSPILQGLREARSYHCVGEAYNLQGNLGNRHICINPQVTLAVTLRMSEKFACNQKVLGSRSARKAWTFFLSDSSSATA
jgi:hypothetical protein